MPGSFGDSYDLESPGVCTQQTLCIPFSSSTAVHPMCTLHPLNSNAQKMIHIPLSDSTVVHPADPYSTARHPVKVQRDAILALLFYLGFCQMDFCKGLEEILENNAQFMG